MTTLWGRSGFDVNSETRAACRARSNLVKRITSKYNRKQCNLQRRS